MIYSDPLTLDFDMSCVEHSLLSCPGNMWRAHESVRGMVPVGGCLVRPLRHRRVSPARPPSQASSIHTAISTSIPLRRFDPAFIQSTPHHLFRTSTCTLCPPDETLPTISPMCRSAGSLLSGWSGLLCFSQSSASGQPFHFLDRLNFPIPGSVVLRLKPQGPVFLHRQIPPLTDPRASLSSWPRNLHQQ